MRVDETQYKEEQEAKLIAIGDFRFEIEKAKEATTDKTKSGKKWELTLGVYDGNGKRHRVYSQVGNWKNGGATNLMSFFDSIGLNGREDHEPEDVIGLRGMLHTRHKPWNGVMQAQVHWWTPATPGQSISLPKDDEDGGDDEFKTEPVRSVSDDDVPF